MNMATVSPQEADAQRGYRRPCGRDCRPEKRPRSSPIGRTKDALQRPLQMLWVLQLMRARDLATSPCFKKGLHAKTSLRNGSKMSTNTPEPQTYAVVGVTLRADRRRGTAVVLVVGLPHAA